MGLVDLDKLLGGGLPLGTLTLIIEDKHSHQHSNLLRYFAAEGMATRQKTLLLSPSSLPGGLQQFLPAEVKAGVASTAASTATPPDSGVAGGAGAGAGGAADTELRIAWQYRKYLNSPQGLGSAGSTATQQLQQPQQQRAGAPAASAAGAAAAAKKAVEAGIGREWCHSFDLTRSASEQDLADSRLELRVCLGPGNLQQASLHAAGFARSFLPASSAPGLPGPAAALARGPESVGRLVIQSLGSPQWRGGGQQEAGEGEGEEEEEGGEEGEGSWREVSQLLYSLRRAVADSRCAAVVSCQADTMPESWQMRLQHMCDVVLAVDTLSDDSDIFKLLPDAASAAALLSVRKLPLAGLVAPRCVKQELYVIRNKRKRLAVTPVEVDPDAEARQQEGLAEATAQLLALGNGGGQRTTPAPQRQAVGHHGLEF
ncbi:Elongator complex protein 4 [Haematococcus lacustris]